MKNMKKLNYKLNLNQKWKHFISKRNYEEIKALNKARKVELLYKKARGQKSDATREELIALQRYKVEFKEGDFYTTKGNIWDYINAVDNGTRLTFYNWCIENRKADRRYAGSSESAIAADDRGSKIAAMSMGWLTWGVAIYWIFRESLSVGVCAVIGAVISLLVMKCMREKAGFMVFLLPLILAAIFGQMWKGDILINLCWPFSKIYLSFIIPEKTGLI